MGISRPNFIVGIGGSAGGLNAYREFLSAVACDTGMAFVVISHIVPTASSQLAEILARCTKMAVGVALEAMPIRPNHVYVCPPDTDLLIENNAFKVISPRAKRNEQVDLFFGSLAEAMGPRAIGIIMSGYDGDGTEGCKKLKARGGTTFAQDTSAEVDGMPVSARASGCIDFVLPPDKMPAALARLIRTHDTQA